MSKWLLTIFVFVVIMLFFTVVVGASHICDNREVVVNHLINKYKMKLASSGLDRTGDLVEVFADSSGKWMMFRTAPNGIICFVNSGEDWKNLSPQTKPTKSKLESEA